MRSDGGNLSKPCFSQALAGAAVRREGQGAAAGLAAAPARAAREASSSVAAARAGRVRFARALWAEGVAGGGRVELS